MDLHSSENFWPVKNGLIRDFPSLQRTEKADIVIMGAGISGALVADLLCKEGYSVVMLDKRDCARGSTAASTALLQYEIDTPLRKLKEIVGIDHAVRSYQLCLNAIDDLEKLCMKYEDNSDFKRKPSFQYTSTKADLKDHQEELELRQLYKISNTKWMSSKDIENHYGFQKPGGILSEDGAEVDPFKLTHNLIKTHLNKNLKVYDNTEVLKIEHHNTGVTLTTDTGFTVKAKKLVIACGYESQKYLKKNIEKQKASYAIISEVMNDKDLWFKNSLIWETANPYLYLRTTADNRILIGGKDDPFKSAALRDQNIPKKVRALEQSFAKLFPHIQFKTDYKWAGTFCETKDGLPYIGSIPERKNTFFALGFGGNGITFSIIAAQLILDAIKNKKNGDLDLFAFNR